eukprot:2540613-Ditylum_brightwellii.AAC.1
MRPTIDGVDSMTVDEHVLLCDDAAEDEENFAVEIKEAKYEEASAKEVAKEQTHLPPCNKNYYNKY